jgi:hypothetical protein
VDSGDPFDNSAGFQFPAPEGFSLSSLPHMLTAQAFIPVTERPEMAGFGADVPATNDSIREAVVARVNGSEEYRKLFGQIFLAVKAGAPGESAQAHPRARPEREARPFIPTINSKGETKMKVKSNVKAGGASLNHNQTAAGLRVKSKMKAGALNPNHNQSVKGLRVKSKVKAGEDRIISNHNQTAKGLRVKSKVKAGGASLNHSQSVSR